MQASGPSAVGHARSLRKFKHAKRDTVRPRASSLLQGLTSLFKGSDGAQSSQQGFGDISLHVEEWYTSRGLRSGPLLLKECGIKGRGLVAGTRVRKGQTVVEVPASMVITPEVALSSSSLEPLLWQQQQEPLPPWSLLALFLAELKHWGTHTQHAQQAQQTGDGGGGALVACAVPPRMASWLPYLEALPESPGTVLEWPRKQVQQLLKGSPLLAKALTIIQGVEASCDQLQPIIKKAEQEGLVPAGALSRDRLVWAFGILLSRLVRLSQKSNEEALVPWADFLNHSPQVDTHLDWDAVACQGAGAVTLQADRDYQAGSQVYISYGPKTSGQLLLSYGFCPTPSTHPHEAYLLTMKMNEDDPLCGLKERALAERGFRETPEWPLKLEGLPSGVVAWSAFRAAGDRSSTEDQIQALATSLFGGPSDKPPEPGALAGPLPPDLELQGLQELGVVCGALMKGYPTSMEEDRALSAASSSQTTNKLLPGTPITSLQQVVAKIRVVERQILARTQFIASSRARELKRANRQ